MLLHSSVLFVSFATIVRALPLGKHHVDGYSSTLSDTNASWTSLLSRSSGRLLLVRAAGQYETTPDVPQTPFLRSQTPRNGLDTPLQSSPPRKDVRGTPLKPSTLGQSWIPDPQFENPPFEDEDPLFEDEEDPPDWGKITRALTEKAPLSPAMKFRKEVLIRVAKKNLKEPSTSRSGVPPNSRAAQRTRRRRQPVM